MNSRVARRYIDGVLMEDLNIEQKIRHRISEEPSIVLAIKGSWVQIQNQETKCITWLPRYRVCRSYV